MLTLSDEELREYVDSFKEPPTEGAHKELYEGAKTMLAARKAAPSDRGELKTVPGGGYLTCDGHINSIASVTTSSAKAGPEPMVVRRTTIGRAEPPEVARARTKAEAIAKATPLLEEAAEKEKRYQGHVGKSVGWLAANAPGRVDGDGDTVVSECNPLRGENAPVSPKPVPEHVQKRARETLAREQMHTLSRVAYTEGEKTEMKELFGKERDAIKCGEDRQPFVEQREQITAEAKKRGSKRPSADAMAAARGIPSSQRARQVGGTRGNKNQGLKESGMGGLPSVQVRMRR